MKNNLERLIAAILLIVVSPLIFLCMIIISFESSGWPLFHQSRIGKGGGQFYICKLRTMTIGGKKLTRFGRLLKYLHIDELPQLINIIKGEMSFVGPRPLMLSEVCKEYYAPRDSNVLPGITGMLQTSFFDRKDTRAREIFDRVYCIRKSLLLDLKIIFYRTPRFIILKTFKMPLYRAAFNFIYQGQMSHQS